MNGGPFGGSPQATGRERRRFPRYEVEIAAVLHKKAGNLHLVSADVSRHGAFLRTDHPAPVRQLVQVRFRLPGHGDIDAMCMVARWLRPEDPRGPGMGLDFFALSKDAKSAWERFIADLRARDFAIGHATHPLSPAMPSTTSSVMLSHPQALAERAAPAATTSIGLPDWLASNSILDEAAAEGKRSRGRSPSMVPLPSLPPPPPPNDDDLPIARTADAEGSVVMLRLPDCDKLQAFVANEVDRGGMFLHTPLQKEVGEKIELVLVHPDSDEEFRLDGTVVRRMITGPAAARGLGIFFRALSPEGQRQLLEFVVTGNEVVEAGTPLSDRQLELEAAVAAEPDSAEALEALGSFLLDDEADLGGALTALTRALMLGPSQVSIHASLARAYRRIGDPVKLHAHERVAEALMMFQERMKVRLGVDDED